MLPLRASSSDDEANATFKHSLPTMDASLAEVLKMGTAAERSINVLLLGAGRNTTKTEELLQSFRAFSKYVKVGGVVVLDEYLSADRQYQMVHGSTRRGRVWGWAGLMETACKTEWHCSTQTSN